MQEFLIWEIVFKSLATVLGIMLVYLSLLYEDEDKKIRNWFIDAWLQLDQADKTLAQKINGVFTNYHRWVEGFVDRLFGAKLLSKRAIYVSYCLSIISFYAMVTVYHISMNLEKIFNGGMDDKLLLGLGVLLAQIFVTTSMIKHAVEDDKKIIKYFWIVMVMTAGTIFLGFATTFGSNGIGRLFIIAYLILMPLFIGTGILFFAGLRLVSRKIKKRSTLLIKLFLFFMSMVFLAALSYLIWSMGIRNSSNTGFSYSFYLSAANVYVFFITLTYMLLIFFYFLNFLLWNLFKRPIYAFQKNDVLKYKHVFVVIGLALLGYAWKDGSDWIEKLF